MSATQQEAPPAPAPLSTASPAPRPSRKAATAALMLMMVLASMEQTVTSTAMPTIIGELHGLEFYAWVISAYLLAATVTMPLYGRLADVWGRKRVLILSVVLFIGGSILCSIAQNMTQLIIFRAVQGLGAGGIMPVVLTILGDIYTIQERSRIQGFFSAVWGTASLAGPWLGAQLVTHAGWRSIFWVNLPFGVLGLIVLMFTYHDHEKPHSTDLDLPGITALALGSTGILLCFSLLGRLEFGAQMAMVIGPLAAITAGLLAYFFWHEKRTGNPVLSPALLFQAAIGPAVLASLLLGVCVFSLDTWVPLYVQGGMGGTAQDAAATVTPVMFGWALSAFLAAPLVVKWGFRRTATVGAILVVAGFVGLLTGAWLGAPRWVLTAVLVLSGLGFGPTSLSYLLGAQDAVEWQQRGLITSTITFARTMGGALGVSVLGDILNIIMRDKLELLRKAGVSPTQLLDSEVQKKLDPAVLHESLGVIAGGLRWIFGLMVLMALVQLIISRWIPAASHSKKVSMAEAVEAAV